MDSLAIYISCISNMISFFKSFIIYLFQVAHICFMFMTYGVESNSEYFER